MSTKNSVYSESGDAGFHFTVAVAGGQVGASTCSSEERCLAECATIFEPEFSALLDGLQSDCRARRLTLTEQFRLVDLCQVIPRFFDCAILFAATRFPNEN